MEAIPLHRGPPPGGRLDSRVQERCFSFSRTHERRKIKGFNDFTNRILSIHESRITNLSEFTNLRTNISIFTGSLTIFLLFTNHEQRRFYEFANDFFHFHKFTKETKPIPAFTNTAGGASFRFRLSNIDQTLLL